MKLNQLTKITTRSSKRLGRGYGSGVGGHTSTRGQKGQKSRSSVKLWFEGGQLPLTKKLPFLRGKDRFKSISSATSIVNLNQLVGFKANETVSRDSLVKKGLLSLKEAANTRVKILGDGEITSALTFKGLIISKSAAAKITKAGGKIETED